MAQQVQTEKHCTQLIFYDKGAPPFKELKDQIENGNTEAKIDAMKTLIMLHINGEPQPRLLMSVIRFILPNENHTLKKLLLLYWEVIDKTGPDGKLLPEMILVCSHIRNDLTHPNEYIRGCTLRFLTKMKEPEILESLVKPVLQNLEHRHSYVKRNAVLAVFAIYRTFPDLIPEAPEYIEKFLHTDIDQSSKRNAFLMLFECAQDRATRYLRTIMDQVTASGDLFQLVLLDLLKKLCRKNPDDKGKYLRVISSLLKSKSSAVLYQCAGTLISLSSSPSAIRAAASTYTQLVLTHSDNNVKLIVLDKLVDLKNRYPVVMQDIVMDLLRALGTPDMDIRRIVIALCLDLVLMKNVDDVIMFLKKELIKAQEGTQKDDIEYRQLLVQSIHACAVKYPGVAHNVHLLMDFLGDAAGTDVIRFVREIMESYPNLRSSIIQKLCSVMHTIVLSKVHRVALWILGNYAETAEEIQLAFNTIKESLGELPFVTEETELLAAQEQKLNSVSQQHQTSKAASALPTSSHVSASKVRSDGTYVTQTALDSKIAADADANRVTLRSVIFKGDFFTASVIAVTLTKLVLQARTLQLPEATLTTLTSESMLIMSSLLSLGQSSIPPNKIDDDSYSRIGLCIRILCMKKTSTSELLANQLRELSRDAFSRILDEKNKAEQQLKAKQQKTAMQADSLITFSQLRGKKQDDIDFEEEDLSLATANIDKSKGLTSKLNRVTQLTGFSDPVYAEATVTVHQFDILLDVFVVNLTNDTLQNLTLELATVGDLKLCERPQNHTLGPFASLRINANIKVSSTETAIIFGNIVYEVSGSSADRQKCVILNDIHIDIMDYISPATCPEQQFRAMWFEFEWENKIAVNTAHTDLRAYLEHVKKATNMNCLTPESAFEGECEFLSANLYARSCFGEDALANLSIERLPNGKIEGFVRIRSKTQGIALSLGDKITKEQKEQSSAVAAAAKTQTTTPVQAS